MRSCQVPTAAMLPVCTRHAAACPLYCARLPCCAAALLPDARPSKPLRPDLRLVRCRFGLCKRCSSLRATVLRPHWTSAADRLLLLRTPFSLPAVNARQQCSALHMLCSDLPSCSYDLTAMLFAPLFGLWTDRTRRFKPQVPLLLPSFAAWSRHLQDRLAARPCCVLLLVHVETTAALHREPCCKRQSQQTPSLLSLPPTPANQPATSLLAPCRSCLAPSSMRPATCCTPSPCWRASGG